MIETYRGITRTVFVTGRWAVKVPSFRSHGRGVRGVLWSVTRGIQANLSEIEWSASPGVCPVKWSLAGVVNVYPRADRLPDGAHIDWGGIGFLGPVDRKEPNVGRLGGRVVMIDYDMSFNDCLHRHHKALSQPGEWCSFTVGDDGSPDNERAGTMTTPRCERLTGPVGSPDHERQCTAPGTEKRDGRNYCPGHATEWDITQIRSASAFAKFH